MTLALGATLHTPSEVGDIGHGTRERLLARRSLVAHQHLALPRFYLRIMASFYWLNTSGVSISPAAAIPLTVYLLQDIPRGGFLDFSTMTHIQIAPRLLLYQSLSYSSVLTI